MSTGVRAVTLKTAQVGDFVVLYASPDSMWSVVLKVNGRHECAHGLFEHQNIINKAYGTKVFAKQGDKWLYLLRPTPELWTLTLGHRTQIIYTRDISVIVLKLDLRNGSLVCESGTGSGSLTTSLACAVAPRGHVFTFEYHQQRADMARTDFEKLGVAPFVTVTHRDAVANGFALQTDANDKLAHWADAVFLDLPNPSVAIAHAVTALKPAVGRLCSFSPCIEQVQATCTALRDAQFHGIETIECLIQPLAMTRPMFDTITVPVHLPKKVRIDRPDMPRQVQEIRGHTSYLTFASAPCVRREQEPTAAATSETATTTTTTTTTTAENNTTNEEELQN